jgi:hypothetical protein
MRTNILSAALAVSDRELLARIEAIAGREREATALLVAHLAALEMRPSLYLAEGYGSLFDYCTGALRLSEDAACNRIDAARAGTRFPLILDMLAAGSLTLTSVRKLRSHLTAENHEAILHRATHRTKDEIDALIAELAPKPDVPASVRKLTVSGTPAPASTPTMPDLFRTLPDPSPDAGLPLPQPLDARPEAGPPVADLLPAVVAPRVVRPIVQPLAPQRYRVQFTIGQETHERLRRVQALLRRQVPDGDPATIFDRALSLLEEVEGKRRGLPTKSRRPAAGGRNYENRIRSGTDKRISSSDLSPGQTERLPDEPSRHIPAAVKRAVWWRDAGQCAFVSDGGRRCTQRSFLELHHIQPYALNGPATVSNISLRCRRHNQYEGEVVFGMRAGPALRKPGADGNLRA